MKVKTNNSLVSENIHYDYIVGKVIKNGNVSNKKQYIQVLTENNSINQIIKYRFI